MLQKFISFLLVHQTAFFVFQIFAIVLIFDMQTFLVKLRALRGLVDLLKDVTLVVFELGLVTN